MNSVICPECGKELNDYEINKLWCTRCNAKFRSKQALCDHSRDINEIKEMQQKLYDNFLITTGDKFEGYIIVKYSNLLNSEVVMGTGILSEINAQISDFLGETSCKFELKLQEAKEMAVQKIIDSAIKIGCNAVIGFKYDMFSLSNNIISVSAYATAVKVIRQESEKSATEP